MLFVDDIVLGIGDKADLEDLKQERELTNKRFEVLLKVIASRGF